MDDASGIQSCTETYYLTKSQYRELVILVRVEQVLLYMWERVAYSSENVRWPWQDKLVPRCLIKASCV